MRASESAVLFLDLQEEIVKNSRTVPVDRLSRVATTLAKAAALHRLPTFLSAVPPGGAFLPGVLDALGNPPTMPRTVTTAFGDPTFVEALKRSGRSTVVIAGVASEIVVQRTALDAIAAGYKVEVAVDACGGISERTEAAAWSRIVAAGGTTTSVVTMIAELAGDFTTPLGGQTLGLMYEAIG